MRSLLAALATVLALAAAPAVAQFITVSGVISPSGGGTIQETNNNQTWPGPAISFNNGTTFNFVATPNAGFVFVNWTGSFGTSTANPFNVGSPCNNCNATIQANFASTGAQADLSITKTDGVTTVTPGGKVTYTITAANAGPSSATGATIVDTLPGALSGATWTCVGAGGGTCTAAGSGNLNDTVNLPVGGSVTYTLSATVAAGATGTLSNTATVAPPAGVTDPTPGNNSATDTDTLAPQAGLGIGKTDGVTTVTAGGTVTYTITAANAGPSSATGATIVDILPAALSGATWTCVGAGGGTCTAAGSGNLNDTVNLPAGGSVTYTLSATVAAGATGTLSNTATVTPPAGVTDPTPGNNSSTDTDILAPQADLSITKTDGVTTVTPGGKVTYTITAANAGPSSATGATIVDTLPGALSGATWTCVGAGGGTCTAAGSGNLNDTVNLPAGGSVTYTLSATVAAGATGTLSNTATVAPPAGVTDPTPGNNSATDTDILVVPPLITKAFNPTNVVQGTPTTLTFTVTNPAANTVALTGVGFTDLLQGMVVANPNGLTGSCGGGTIAAVSLTNTIALSGATLPVNGTCTFSVSVTAITTGTLTNITGNVTSANGGTGGTATAQVTVTAAIIPTLSQWGLIVASFLTLLMALGVLWRRRRGAA